MAQEFDVSVLDGPVPGEGLTSNPDAPEAWETAPEYTDLEGFVDDLFMNITKEENIDGVLDPIRKKIPVEDVAQMLLFQAMSSGKINTDLVLTAVEPTIYMLIGLSEYAGISDPVLYPEDEMQVDEEDEVAMLESMGDPENTKLEDIPVPKGVSQSLLQKLEGGEINGD